MTTTATQAVSPTVTNGVNVTALFETIDAVKQMPEIAAFNFSASNHWVGGDHNRSVISGFSGACDQHIHVQGPFVMDNAEPPVLLGAGAAPNPVEFVLHALVGCMTTTMVYHAAARGITIRSIQSDVQGDLDLRGFLGMDDTVRKGFSSVRVTMQVKADADSETLKSLTQYSPVFEMISKSLPVEVTVEQT